MNLKNTRGWLTLNLRMRVINSAGRCMTTDGTSTTHFVWSILYIIFRRHIPITLRLIIILKELRQSQHSFISNVTSFGPFDGPSSDLYTRTNEGTYTIICIILIKKRSLPLRRFIKLWITPLWDCKRKLHCAR